MSFRLGILDGADYTSTAIGTLIRCTFILLWNKDDILIRFETKTAFIHDLNRKLRRNFFSFETMTTSLLTLGSCKKDDI